MTDADGVDVSNAFDKDEMLEQFDGDVEFINELIDTFVSGIHDQMSNIKEAIDSGDCRALDESAHRFKGASSNFGKNAVFETSLKLETMGKGGCMDGALEVYGQLEKDVERLKAAFKAFSDG